MDEFMNIAIMEAKKSLLNDDIPVGALIICNGKIISQAHNKKELLNDATKHAEILAIETACRKLNTWHLDECILVTTMEPCMMCCGAIVQSRIKKVVYGVSNEKFGYSKLLSEKYKVNCVKYSNNSEILDMLKKFFKEKR